jgi:hypothetical protein
MSRQTIRCATCGQDSGASAALDGAALAALDGQGWSCAVPEIGRPFRFYCPRCWPVDREEPPAP